MAERAGPPWRRASVRVRTTVTATVVVAVVLVAGALALVLTVRASLRDGLVGSAEERASTLVEEVESSGVPASGRADDDDPGEPDDLVWQVTGADGTVRSSSEPLRRPLPLAADDEAVVALPGADHRYVVVTEEVDAGGEPYDVTVAVSLEEVDDSTAALLPPLLVGVPLVLLLVGGTTWMVATWALAPVERIRREVDRISGETLDLRVPEPPTGDEVHRLATTMNQMLGRLEGSRARQRRFVADASHELRSPLASIRQTAEVARAHPGALGEGELADAVLEESTRMQRLVEQLLLLTRADERALTPAPAEVDLDDLVLEEAARLRRGGLAVDTSRVSAGRVRGDRAALAQVVRNLADNAARHASSSVVLSVAESGRWVEVAVEDDGAGIPEEHRERVFERFVRLDEARARDTGGSGLGLAIVQELVTAHGGTVAASSSARGGARLVVRLPSPAATDEGRARSGAR